MRLSNLDLSNLQFRTSEEVFDELRAACEANPDLALFDEIGQSREGRPIAGVTLGYGSRLVTLIAGSHADEPVGPETLRTFILEGLAARDWLADGDGLHQLFEDYTFRIIPHVNPDGEARNQAWINEWPSLSAYLLNRVREAPGDDIEFGYPSMRPENQAVSDFLFDGSPITLHMSLHGMGYSEGALLLIEKSWAESVPELKFAFVNAAQRAGMRLHDQDRKGDKGFQYYGPGFWSTPEGRAMRAHFESAGDPETASKFHLSSMELAIERGTSSEGDSPLCLVTELPLFYLSAAYDHKGGVAGLLDKFRAELPRLTAAARNDTLKATLLSDYGLIRVPLEDAIAIQLRTIELGLSAIG